MSCVVHTCVVWTVGSKGLCGEVLGCRDGQLLGTVVVRGLCCPCLCCEDRWFYGPVLCGAVL